MQHIRWSMVVLPFAIMSCETPVATRPDSAYDPTVITAGLARWPSGTHVRVAIATANLPPTTDLAGALDRAIAAWNAVPQYGEFVLERASSAMAADVLLYDQITPIPFKPVVCDFNAHGATGYTYFCPSQFASASPVARPDSVLRIPLAAGGGSVAVVIQVNRGRVASPSAYDAAVAHEIGHALGIEGHSSDASDVMFGNPTATQPTARDRATLRAVLGATMSIRL